MDWVNSLAGFVVGVMVGLTGVGGGALMTPVLVLLLGVNPTTAIGTDLWFAAITKIFGGAVYHRKNSIDWQIFRRLSLGSLPAALLTLFWLQWSGAAKLQQNLFTQALGGVLLLTAIAMLFKQHLHTLGRKLRTHTPDQFKKLQPALTVIAGAILGTLVTMTSVGAGALGAAILLYLYPFRMTPQKLVGTDIVHAIPLTIVAGTGHFLMGNVNFTLLGALLLGSIPGVFVGSIASTKAPEAILRAAIAVALTAISFKILI